MDAEAELWLELAELVRAVKSLVARWKLDGGRGGDTSTKPLNPHGRGQIADLNGQWEAESLPGNGILFS